MRRVFTVIVVVIGAIMIRDSFDESVQAQNPSYGPGSKGAVLVDPFAPPSKKAPATQTTYVNTLFQDPKTPSSQSKDFSPKVDINKDILVTPAQGPWMIFVASYSGPNASEWARQLAMELRGPKYKLPAYIFNYGAEERAKENKRLQEIVAKQREFLTVNNIESAEPLRVRTVQIDEKCGVLIAGYATDDAARKDLNRKIHSLPPLDPTKVQLDTKFYTNAATKKAERVYVNPFQETAIVARNPSMPNGERVEEKMDMNLLRVLNSDEPFSLLNSKKPITLAIRQIATPVSLQSRSMPTGGVKPASAGLMGGGMFGSSDVDPAAQSAHNLCELLRKAKLDAYVLHTKYSSVITVGAFDSLEDPAMANTQKSLQSFLPKLQTQLAAVLPKGSEEFFPTPMPMKVPR